MTDYDQISKEQKEDDEWLKEKIDNIAQPFVTTVKTTSIITGKISVTLLAFAAGIVMITLPIAIPLLAFVALIKYLFN